MSTVYIVTDLFSKNEVELFSTECNFYRNILKDTDLSDFGAAIDIFEDSQLCESDAARYDPQSFFTERWRNYYPGVADSEAIRHILSTKLPSIICGIYSCEHLHIFNESYIVKDSNSQIAFRWHTDSDEQLGAIPRVFRPEYFSAWCPLDDTNTDNGTLAFPIATNIVSLKFQNSGGENNCFFVKSHGTVADIPAGVPIFLPSALPLCPTDDEVGLSVEVKAGSVVLFSSNTWHRSGDNTTELSRRVLYVQYSPCAITANSLPPSKNSNKIPLLWRDSSKVQDFMIDDSPLITSSKKEHCNSENNQLRQNPYHYLNNGRVGINTSDPFRENPLKKKKEQEYPLCFAVACSPIIPTFRTSSEIIMRSAAPLIVNDDLSSTSRGKRKSY